MLGKHTTVFHKKTSLFFSEQGSNTNTNLFNLNQAYFAVGNADIRKRAAPIGTKVISSIRSLLRAFS